MADPVQNVPTPIGEYQAHFGGPPGDTDAVAECKKWEKLCGELLVERERLRSELAKTQTERDQYFKALMRAECENYTCSATADELLANAIYEPTIPELLAALAKDPER
jgi:hypothetical protein